MFAEAMVRMSGRQLYVHLLPQLVPRDALRGGVAIVIDVLRASTTVIHALASGCVAVWPVMEVDQAQSEAKELRSVGYDVILGGERGGLPIPGFDLGNSPADYVPDACKDRHLVLTTTNGTRALHHATPAERVLIASFVNFSAVCEQILRENRPLHFLCAGTDGEITLEDTLLAGAFVEVLHNKHLLCNDSARLAWDCFEHHGMVLVEALKLSKGGRNLITLGCEDDIALAGQVDRFRIVPELQRQPLRLEVGALGLGPSRWPQS